MSSQLRSDIWYLDDLGSVQYLLVRLVPTLVPLLCIPAMYDDGLVWARTLHS
jgi:hypothetical protein